MTFYITNIIVFALYAFVIRYSIKNYKTSEKIILVVTALHFGTILCLRNIDVGVDTFTYSRQYLAIAESDANIIELYSQYRNIGLAAIEKLFSYIIPQRNGYMILTGVIITCLFWIFIKYNSVDVTFSVYLFITFTFYFSAFNVSRQYIAMGLTLLVYQFLKSGKWKLSIPVFLIALSVHNISIVCAALYLVYFIKWSKKSLAIYLVSMLLALIGYSRLISLFYRLFNSYEMYSVNDSLWEGGARARVFYAIYFAVGIIGFWLAEKGAYDDEENKKCEVQRLSVLTLTGGIVGLVFANNTLMSRLTVFYSIYVIILTPIVFDNIFKRYTKNWYIARGIVYAVMMIPVIYMLGKGLFGVIPYSIYS